MPSGGHFCAHGNLRYSCAKCREERQAKRAPGKRVTYGQPLGRGGKIPARPWRLDAALTPLQAEALATMRDADGVVMIPAPLGLRTLAFALLRSLRDEGERVIFLVPSPRAAEAWATALTTQLHVPADEIDHTGRNVRDWARLAPVVIWTPETMLRHRSALAGQAKDTVLFVDSPEHPAYERLTSVFAFRFARRIGLAAARLGPPEPTSLARHDALGGIRFLRTPRDAISEGQFRLPRHQYLVTAAKTMAEEVVAAAVAAAGTGAIIIHVDDAEVGRAIEQAAADHGAPARFVAGLASEEGARRAARVVHEGGARILVRTADAPPTPVGPPAVLVHADVAAGSTRRAQRDLVALSADVPAGALHIIDVLPATAPSAETAEAFAERVMDARHCYGSAIPRVPWLLEALAVPPLPDDVAAAVARADTWQDTLGHLPTLLGEAWSEPVALAALADAHIAARLGAEAVPLGPPPADPADLLAAEAHGPDLALLTLLLPEARPLFAAWLERDLAALVTRHAAAPLLHHWVPDLRPLLIRTARRMLDARIPEIGDDPVAAADLLARRGPRLPRLEPPTVSAPPRPLSPEPHLERLVAALDAEKALETEESVDEIARLTARERQRQGRTLLGLRLLGKERTASGLALRYGLAGERGGRRPPLPYTELSPGSLVDLSSGDAYDPMGRGTVSALRADEITILVEEDRERRAPGRETRIDLVGNPRVYDLLQRAVRIVYGPGGLFTGTGPGGLKEHLLERATPAAGSYNDLPTFDPLLDDSQRAAVAAAIGAPALTLIHGPPGTGKTTTLVELLLQEAARGQRILVTTDSNAAVDTLMDAFLRRGGMGVRTGPRPSLTRPHLAFAHIDTLNERAAGIDWLQRAPVVFTTHVSSASLPRDLRFDLVVQDEASQATEPASCASLSRAPRLVLAGDHLQLPPVVRSPEAERLGLKTSLFERLHTAYGEGLGHLLSVQYRMHRDIEAWSNDAFYDGRIETAVEPPPVEHLVTAGLLPSAPRALFVDVAGAESAHRTSKERKGEAEWIADFVRRALASGVRAEQIAVIAAYRAQVRLLRGLLDDTEVDVGTIDAFQGSERDVVVVSLVRGNPKGEVGFVREPRRLNVAMTRARRHLVVVGHEATLRREPRLADLLDHLGRMS